MAFDNVRAMLDAHAIGDRIYKARTLAGLSQNALGALLQKNPKDASGKAYTGSAVGHWEKGKGIPEIAAVQLLCRVFSERLAPDYDEEWLLFGERREGQLRQERPHLTWVTPEEIELLTKFRQTSSSGREMVVGMADLAQKQHPINSADIHQLRRKGYPQP